MIYQAPRTGDPVLCTVYLAADTCSFDYIILSFLFNPYYPEANSLGITRPRHSPWAAQMGGPMGCLGRGFGPSLPAQGVGRVFLPPMLGGPWAAHGLLKKQNQKFWWFTQIMLFFSVIFSISFTM
jgi:hypothetical protein